MEEAEVRLCYDEHRIPHFFSGEDAGVFFGLGYQQVRDFPVATLGNLWSSSGRFAHVAGPEVIERDERMRLWQVDVLARRQAEDPDLLDPAVRPLMLAYVQGVNRGRRLWLEHPEWIESLAGADGQELAFQPVPSWLLPLENSAPAGARLRRLFEAEIELEHVLSFGLSLNGGPEFYGGAYSTATNVLLVRNDTRSRTALALIDSHQPIESYAFRPYVAHLSGRDYEVAGYTLPGFPCIIVGFNDSLAFQYTSLPRGPEELRERNLPFRYHGSSPAVTSTWRACLEPDPPLRFRRGDQTVPLDVERVTLRYWDCASGELREDPRGELALCRVPADLTELSRLGLSFPVIAPEPERACKPGSEVWYQGRTFLLERNAFEFWIRIGLCRRTGAGEGGTDEVLRSGLFSIGNGGLFSAIDDAGGLEYMLLACVPRPGASARRHSSWAESVALDGNDPGTAWEGVHRFEDLPRLADGGSFGEHPRVWVNCNASPHFVADEGAFDPAPFAERPWVYANEPWKSWRQDRARELLEAQAATGRVTLHELTRVALDVQDSWSRTHWPFFRALRDERELSSVARGFVDWIEALRSGSPPASPGEREFLAVPESRITPWLVLLRRTYLERLLSLEQPTALELGLGFDPVQPVPEARRFLADDTWARNRAAMLAALEQTATCCEATRDGRAEGLANCSFWSEVRARWSSDDAIQASRTGGALVSGEAGKEDAGLRWGDVSFYALTPHARPLPVSPSQSASQSWFASLFLPGLLSRTPFHARQLPLLIAAPGTESTLFQSRSLALEHASGPFQSWNGRSVFLRPVDFGSQMLLAVQLREGRPPQARVLALLPTTELLASLPGLVEGVLERRLAAQRFGDRSWAELVLEEGQLARSGRTWTRLGFSWRR